MRALSTKSEKQNIDYGYKNSACLLIKLTFNKEKWEKEWMLLTSSAEKGSKSKCIHPTSKIFDVG